MWGKFFTFADFYTRIQTEAAKLKTLYQPQLREGIVLSIDLVNTPKEDEKDGDVDVRVGIVPNNAYRNFKINGTTISKEESSFLANYNKNQVNKHEIIKNKEIDFIFTIETTDNCYGIIWENNNETQDRASLVFKSSKKDYNKQIKIIAKLIQQYYAIRNVLRLKKNETIRKKLGWVGRILKTRGIENAFDLWKAKLDKVLNSEAVPSLDWEETQKLIDSLINELKPKMSLPVIINDSDLPTGELLEQASTPSYTKTEYKKILQALKQLNTLLEEQLNQQNHARKSS